MLYILNCLKRFENELHLVSSNGVHVNTSALGSNRVGFQDNKCVDMTFHGFCKLQGQPLVCKKVKIETVLSLCSYMLSHCSFLDCLYKWRYSTASIYYLNLPKWNATNCENSYKVLYVWANTLLFNCCIWPDILSKQSKVRLELSLFQILTCIASI